MSERNKQTYEENIIAKVADIEIPSVTDIKVQEDYKTLTGRVEMDEIPEGLKFKLTDMLTQSGGDKWHEVDKDGTLTIINDEYFYESASYSLECIDMGEGFVTPPWKFVSIDDLLKEPYPVPKLEGDVVVSEDGKEVTITTSGVLGAMLQVYVYDVVGLITRPKLIPYTPEPTEYVCVVEDPGLLPGEEYVVKAKDISGKIKEVTIGEFTYTPEESEVPIDPEVPENKENSVVWKGVDDAVYETSINFSDVTIISNPTTTAKEILSWGESSNMSDYGISIPGGTLEKVPAVGPTWTTNYNGLFLSQTKFNDPNVTKWDTSNITNMSWMFSGASSFNQPIGDWDTSNVTDMPSMFWYAGSFNQPLDNWDTSNMTNMMGMFNGASSFNQPIGDWDTSNVTNMYAVFNGASSFNQPISDWDVGNVTDMTAMFAHASSFNQDLSMWCVENIESEPDFFDTGADAWTLPRPIWGTCPKVGPVDDSIEEGFIKYRSEVDGEIFKYEITTGENQLPDDAVYIVNWGTTDLEDVTLIMSPNLLSVPDYIPPYITSMCLMFDMCSNFNDPNVSKWDVSNVTDMSYVFNVATSFNQPLDEWDTSNVTDMMGMFTAATSFNQPLDNWDTSNVSDMTGMLSGASSFDQPLNSWDTSHVTNMAYMFAEAAAFNQPLNNWDVSNVTEMEGMFYGASSFNQDLSQWCVINISTKPDDFDTNTDNWMLPRPIWGTCPKVGPADDSIEEGFIKYRTDEGGEIFKYEIVEGENQLPDDAVYIVNWGTTDIRVDVIKLPEGVLGVPDYAPPYITSLNNMFYNCSNFNDPNVTKWDTSNITNMSWMFRGAERFNQPIDDWDTSNVTDMSRMFSNAGSFNQPINNWDVSNVTDMRSMFYGATSFNQPLNNWDVSNVTDMRTMLYNTTKFNQPLKDWDVSNVTDMYGMFWNASSFNQDLSMWCVINIPTKPADFDTNTGNWTLPRPVWGTCGGKIVSIEGFIQHKDNKGNLERTSITHGVTTLPEGIVEVLDWGYLSESDYKSELEYSILIPSTILNVPDRIPPYINSMESMFEDCELFIGTELAMWDVSKIISMKATFKNTKVLDVDLSNWDTSNVTTMEEMFMNSGIKE